MLKHIFLLFAIMFLNVTQINADESKCNYLHNSGFEQDTTSWSTYSVDTKLTNDAYQSSKAISIQNGGIDQIISINENSETYHFNGYYKTKNAPDGVWVGLNFYDKKHNLILAKTIALQNTSNFEKFTVSATSTKNTTYIQTRIWCDSDSTGGIVIMDDLKLSTNGCYNFVAPSSLPPKGIGIKEAPQFVVIGFDDNTMSEGIDWALNLFKDKKNSDGSEARVSFYMNTEGLNTWMEDDPQNLLSAMQRLKDSNHEIGNHTYDHFRDKNEKFIKELDETGWYNEIKLATDNLVQQVGVKKDKIYGFRTPYLLYTQNTLTQIKSLGFTYDCSIEEGSAQMYNGTNFRWPYQLNLGSPGHIENWYGNPDNPEHIEIGSVEGLWELPNHVMMIPKDNECAKYGIVTGLWSRIVSKIPHLHDYKITGFDYNLWSLVALNKAEFLGILKYNLDLRLKGNRAPFMIGAHTQYYTSFWANTNAPNATVQDMRQAIEEFIDYALSKQEVKIRPAIDIINWCNNPIPIN